MAAALAKGDADAISMWEPESQNAVEALGKDAVIFQNNKIYREFYSIYSTTDVMNDPRRRAQLVEFVRAINTQTNELKKNPKPLLPAHQPRHEASRGSDRARLGTPRLPLQRAGRHARHHHRGGEVGRGDAAAHAAHAHELAGFIDTSILKEALGR